MIKIFTALFALLLMCGIVFVAAYSQRSTMPEGQAGVMYLETEDGEKVEISDLRPAERTLPPVVEGSAKPKDGSSGSPAFVAGPTKEGADEEWLTKFTLIERSGKRMGSAELKGQPYVAGFFFTSCPSICPKQNEKVKQLQEKFKGQPIRLVSISCDPEVDRPEVLAAYADRFQADKEQWLFFTGDLPYVSRVGAEYFGLGIMRYAHPEKFALMDAEGKLFGYYTWSDANQWQALQADMARLVAAGGTIKEEGSEK